MDEFFKEIDPKIVFDRNKLIEKIDTVNGNYNDKTRCSNEYEQFKQCYNFSPNDSKPCEFMMVKFAACCVRAGLTQQNATPKEK